jgi:GGDEF domain-containing protein
MSEGYRPEAGDVLFSLQALLAREEQRRDGSPSARDAATPEPGKEQTSGWLPEFWKAERSTVVPLPAPGRSEEATQAMAGHPSQWNPSSSRPPTDLGLIDPETGAGTVRALRRDLFSELSYAPASPSVVALKVERAGEGEQDDRSEEDLVRAVAEVVPFVVRGRDRVYRTGPTELALLMPRTDDEGAGVALARLLTEVPRIMAERKLGQVRLVPRLLSTEGLRPQVTGAGG